jgi:hypothetical protein
VGDDGQESGSNSSSSSSSERTLELPLLAVGSSDESSASALSSSTAATAATAPADYSSPSPAESSSARPAELPGQVGTSEGSSLTPGAYSAGVVPVTPPPRVSPRPPVFNPEDLGGPVWVTVLDAGVAKPRSSPKPSESSAGGLGSLRQAGYTCWLLLTWAGFWLL